jgi:hypothetical protein
VGALSQPTHNLGPRCDGIKETPKRSSEGKDAGEFTTNADRHDGCTTDWRKQKNYPISIEIGLACPSRSVAISPRGGSVTCVSDLN